MLKNRKLITKRLTMTKNGKILHRICGQNHYNSSESGATTKNKRGLKPLSKSLRKTVRQYLG